MTIKHPTTLAAFAFAFAAACGALHAAPLGTGSALPAFDLADQHGAAVMIAPSIRRVVFAADKAGADLASAALASQPAGVLQRHQAVYIADVSGMPGLVFRMFALPKLRELPFAVALVQDAAVTADLPRQAGKVTVLQVDQRVVTQLSYAGDARALLQALGAADGK